MRGVWQGRGQEETGRKDQCESVNREDIGEQQPHSHMPGYMNVGLIRQSHAATGPCMQAGAVAGRQLSPPPLRLD
jgi:hypothetical protein